MRPWNVQSNFTFIRSNAMWNGVLRVVPFKFHFLIRFWFDHDETSMDNANINALYAGSLRIKYLISLMSNFISGVLLKWLTVLSSGILHKWWLWYPDCMCVSTSDDYDILIACVWAQVMIMISWLHVCEHKWWLWFPDCMCVSTSDDYDFLTAYV